MVRLRVDGRRWSWDSARPFEVYLAEDRAWWPWRALFRRRDRLRRAMRWGG